ncbi:MAG TPA: hypothetical protein VGO04_09430 [Ensifer sp.]|jgi:hypothetical protein|uniref:hypothetical protein n=1 Tax=Ensifer sp. TaxID=1872086 RepID=UPI002E14B858|nr:hypothetical protein [Ensifer sp.]
MLTILPGESIAKIAVELGLRAAASGPVILGSQLGILINDALAPQNTKDFGGLRSVVQDQLSEHVRLVTTAAKSNDFVYEIISSNASTKRPLQPPQHEREVSGADLWRFFSNPKLDCIVTATPAGVVMVSPLDAPVAEHAVRLRRVEAREYQQWAGDFANEHSLQDLFAAASQTEDFYRAWIPGLRKSHAHAVNLLKKWEILRTEKVASHLKSELEQAGVEASRVAEILRLARPVGRPVRPPTIQLYSAIEQQPIAQLIARGSRTLSADAAESTAPSDELARMRKLLHSAVDVMTLSELQAINISAGTWISLVEPSTL